VALLSALALAAACEATGASPVAGPTSSSTTAPPTSTTGADDGGPRVLFAGDSLMEEVHAATAAALGDSAETRFLLSPRLIRDDGQRIIWQHVLDDFRPDVVVVIFSHWERLVTGAQTAADFDRIGVQSYADTLARPFADFVNRNGAALVWLSAPPSRDGRVSQVHTVMNQAYRAATAAADAHFIELDPVLTDRNGAYAELLTNPFGVVERVRNTDGFHLCPGGAVRVAEAVLAPLAEVAAVAADPSWANGPWRTDPPFDQPDECPAV
jgi:hypothetical protein